MCSGVVDHVPLGFLHCPHGEGWAHCHCATVITLRVRVCGWIYFSVVGSIQFHIALRNTEVVSNFLPTLSKLKKMLYGNSFSWKKKHQIYQIFWFHIWHQSCESDKSAFFILFSSWNLQCERCWFCVWHFFPLIWASFCLFCDFELQKNREYRTGEESQLNWFSLICQLSSNPLGWQMCNAELHYTLWWDLDILFCACVFISLPR